MQYMQSAALLRLLQLASPSLPVGAYTYSQGLESAIETGLVRNEAAARAWIVEALGVISRFEAPIFWRLMKAFSRSSQEQVTYWTERFVAARDTTEMRAETIQMGYSLRKLLEDLGIAKGTALLDLLQSQPEVPMPTALACATEALNVPHESALLGMLFSWAENQVLVCVKSVPLGQVGGQRLLFSLHNELEAAAEHAKQIGDSELTNWAPGLSILSMQHEVQYSRVYRS